MPDFNFYIDTPRLTISHFNSALDPHCDLLVNLYNSPEVKAFNHGVSAPTPDREAARKNIEANQERTASLGYGRYLVSLKPLSTDPTNPNADDSQAFSERSQNWTKIGIVSMKTRKFPGAPTLPDVGFSFFRQFWGKGYATEAASALMKYFEEEKGINEFLGYCHPDNENSKAMMRRLGYEEAGVRKVWGMAPDGKAFEPLVWSKGLKKSIEEYGVGEKVLDG